MIHKLETQAESDANKDGQPNWLRLRLRQPGMNSAAIGAKITVTTGESTQKHAVMPTKSYLAQSPQRLTIGLGSSTTADVEVMWPDGKVSSYNTLESNQAHTLSR